MEYELVITEKPSVAKAISRALNIPDNSNMHPGYIEGGGYIISWCIGHLVELATPEKYDASLKKWSINTLPIEPNTTNSSSSSSTQTNNSQPSNSGTESSSNSNSSSGNGGGGSSASVDAPNQDIAGENLVWVPNNGGTKYHSKSSCSNMNGPSQIPLAEAEARGYTPCKRCH